MKGKPRVHTKCPANAYTGPHERIVEFGSEAGGGLIAFRLAEDQRGRTVLDVVIYNHARRVYVRQGKRSGL